MKPGLLLLVGWSCLLLVPRMFGGAALPPAASQGPEADSASEEPAIAEPGGSAPGTATVPLLTFAQRQQWVLSAVAANPRAALADATQPFWVAEACFRAGQDDQGRALAREGYLFWAKKDPARIRATDFFRLWPAMDCYVRYKDRLDAPSKAAFERLMTNISCYSYAYTPNLSLLLWTTRLLGEQEWGADAFVPMRSDNRSHYRADPTILMRDRLLHMVDVQAATGGEEYASRPYGAADLAPILELAELASDPTLKQHARLAHEATLARYAPIWLRGAMLITSRRSYPDIFDDPAGVAEWFWMFFGGDLVPGVRGHAVEAALLGQAAPAPIEHAATDRSQPYTVLNRFQENSSGRQISWVERDYGVFSESFGPHPRPFGQTYPFGVRWIDSRPHRHSFLWFTVPLLDQVLPGNFPGSHPHGFDLDGQCTFQHEGSLLYICQTDGARKAHYPYGLAFIPGDALATIDEAATAGRVFLSYPGVLIAFQATKPFPWDHQAALHYASGTPAPGDSEFRVPGPIFAAAIETAPAGEFPGATAAEQLRAFRGAIITHTKLSLLPNAVPAASYMDRHGQVMRRTFGGAAEVNGTAVDFASWPLADSPWVKQAAATAPLVVKDGYMCLTYDFKKWNVQQTLP